MKGERTDKLRRRPNIIRYFFLAITKVSIHTGMSYGGLIYAHKKYGVDTLYVADLLTENIIPVTEPLEDFLTRWRAHYNNPDWDYAKDLERGMPVPII